MVSTGNEADLGALEIAAYLLEDAATDVIALLVEGFRDSEGLAPVARRAAELGKKLVVAKLGRSAPGRQAAMAHTAHEAGDDGEYGRPSPAWAWSGWRTRRIFLTPALRCHAGGWPPAPASAS